MIRPTALERAFELARSGKHQGVDAIKKALRAEDYRAEEIAQIVGQTLFTQLRKLIAEGSSQRQPVTATGAQLKAARETLGWTRKAVAAELCVHAQTIAAVESKPRPTAPLVDRLHAIYSAAGVQFIAEPGGEPEVKLGGQDGATTIRMQELNARGDE